MVTYQELLLSEEWKSKRLKILQRDKHVCTNCKNAVLKDFPFEFGFLNRRHLTRKRLIYKLTSGVEVSASIEALRYNSTILSNMIFYYVKEAKQFSTAIAARRVKKSDQIPSELSELKAKVTLSEDEWIFVNNLHVHHKFYILNKFPWDYDDSALQTLCWSCHEELHSHTKVPVYDDHNNQLTYYTPCKRCFGAGHFPEYSYIQNGICFRCNGARYEDLIGKGE